MKTTYIALLRAINVGGHSVKMENLRQLFTDLGFSNVRSYIQSGNIFFESDEADRQKLTDKIQNYLLEKLGYAVDTILLTIPELEEILALDPFKGIKLTDDRRFYIIFLAIPLPKDFLLPYKSEKGDFEILSATPLAAFTLLTLINDRPSNPGAFIEKKLKIRTTARFFHTTIKLLEAAKSTK